LRILPGRFGSRMAPQGKAKADGENNHVQSILLGSVYCLRVLDAACRIEPGETGTSKITFECRYPPCAPLRVMVIGKTLLGRVVGVDKGLRIVRLFRLDACFQGVIRESRLSVAGSGACAVIHSVRRSSTRSALARRRQRCRRAVSASAAVRICRLRTILQREPLRLFSPDSGDHCHTESARL
jgi:hypothetical protein